jgi:hypothetical protein
MIDDKPVKQELNLAKRIQAGFAEISKGIFSFFGAAKQAHKSELIETDETEKKAIDCITDLSGENSKGLIVSFSTDINTVLDGVKRNGIDIDSLYVIDCISYITGKGSPLARNLMTLNKVDDFENLHQYTFTQLDIMKSPLPFVIVLSPHNLLDYTDYNEVGMFFGNYIKTLKEKNVPITLIVKTGSDPILTNMLKEQV